MHEVFAHAQGFLDAGVIALLAAHLLLTVIFATPAKAWRGVSRPLLVRMVPRWNFFAPDPGVHDFHLLIRDRSIDGEVGPWRSIDEFDSPRPWFACLWNPSKRAKKALFDVTCSLVQETQVANDDERTKLQLSVPYLMLASLVDARQRSQFSVERQFCLVQRSALEPAPVLVFTSEFHRLESSE